MITETVTRAIQVAKAGHGGQAAGWPRCDQIELVPNPVCCCDAKGTIVASNSAAVNLWGNGKSHAGNGFACGFEHLFWPDGSPLSPDRAPVAWVLASGESFHALELRAERNDGRRLALLADIAPLVDRYGGTTGAIMSFHDITEMRRRSEADYQCMLLDALRRLAGEVAHDFDNVLAPIHYYFETLALRPDGSRAARIAENAQQSAGYGQYLANRLSEFAHTTRLSREETDVNALVAMMGDVLAREWGDAPKLTLRLCDELWPARVDGIHLERGIRHLLENAREALPKGGTVTIQTSNVRLAAPKGYLPCGPYVVISVADTGPGILEGDKKQAFEPLFTTKTGGKSVGLGLSIVLGMARQHGGDVRIENRTPHGTQVDIYLPCDDPSASQIEEATAGIATTTHRAAPILIVDDDRDFRMALLDAFDCVGLQVMDADSATAAIEILQSSQPLDVLVVDYSLGRVDGAEVLRQAQTLRPGIKALMMTGHSNLSCARLGIRGDVDFLNKPFAISEFMERLRRLAPHLLIEKF